MALANTLKRLSKNVGNYISDNSPAILTALGITGFCTAIVVTAKQAPKAKEALEELDDDLELSAGVNGMETYPTKPQKLWLQTKAVAPIYAPSVLLAATSTACVIGGYNVNAKRTAALATAYELSETARREFITKAEEKLGTKKVEEIKDEIAKEHLEQNPLTDETQIIHTGYGDTLFYDDFTGRYFRASVQKLKEVKMKLENEVEFGINNRASYNELYYLMNIPCVRAGNDSGFVTDDLNNGELDITWHQTFFARDNEPCAILHLNGGPLYR